MELRDNIRFIHREMVWHRVVKIGSRQHYPFGRYDDSRAEHFYSYNVIKHRTFSRKLSHIYGTVSAKIAPRLKCYKNASRLYNFPTDNAIDFLFSTLHTTPFHYEIGSR